MVERLEEYYWYQGLYGEVVTDDCYKLRTINFVPDIIFDLGANCGIFSRYAREMFPDAQIVAVEPNHENCELFRKFTDMTNVTLLEKAIGIGKVTERDCTDGVYSYMSNDAGSGERLDVDVETILLHELLEEPIKAGKRIFFKMDVEGGEYCIFDKPYQWELLRQLDHVAIELHWHGYHKDQQLHQIDINKVYIELALFYNNYLYTITNNLFIATKRNEPFIPYKL